MSPSGSLLPALLNRMVKGVFDTASALAIKAFGARLIVFTCIEIGVDFASSPALSVTLSCALYEPASR